MRYAVPEEVYRRLEIDPEEEGIDDILTALEDLEEGVAAVIDAKCNRSFGNVVGPVTRDLAYTHKATGVRYTDRFLLDNGMYFFTETLTRIDDAYLEDRAYISPFGMRNVSSVEVFTNRWGDGVVLDPEDYQLVLTRTDGWSMGILLPHTHYDIVLVTAEWDDVSTATVPPDIREAATFLVVDEWRVRDQSPAGEIGPPGLTTYLRNAWEFELVKTAIDRNRARQLVI